jgi:hypothetical protein
VGLSPTTWEDRQVAFRARFDPSNESVARTHVHWRATPPTFVRGPRGVNVWFLVSAIDSLLCVVWRLAHRMNLSSQPVLSIWPIDAEPGSKAPLIFEIDPFPSNLEGDGTLYGECEMTVRSASTSATE